MTNRFPDISLSLPGWVDGFLDEQTLVYSTREDRMRFVIRLSSLNVRYGTGGPFGAAVFDCQTHRLISIGVNIVVQSNCSVAHAEMVAMMFAQQALKSHDLGARGIPACELITSAEPCAMCLGAIPWSGIRRLVCGALKEDVCNIGFDEGSRPSDWVDQLGCRGIQVERAICRDEAVAVLHTYQQSGGLLYNGSTHQT